MKYILFIISAGLAFGSCRDKVVCPAFQSTYIHNDSVRMAYFSSLWRMDKKVREEFLAMAQVPDDSASSAWTPYYQYVNEFIQPIPVQQRTKYGIVKYEPEWMKRYQLRSAPMEDIPNPVFDNPAPILADSLGLLAMDTARVDSITVASAAMDSVNTVDSLSSEVIVKQEPVKPVYLYKYDPKDNHNVEQEYYNKYFGKLLVAAPPKTKKEAKPLDQPVNRQDVLPSDSTQVPDQKKSRQRKSEKVEAVENQQDGN